MSMTSTLQFKCILITTYLVWRFTKESLSLENLHLPSTQESVSVVQVFVGDVR